MSPALKQISVFSSSQFCSLTQCFFYEDPHLGFCKSFVSDFIKRYCLLSLSNPDYVVSLPYLYLLVTKPMMQLSNFADVQ